MNENVFDILSLKSWRILRYIERGYKSLLFIQRYKVKRITKSTKKTWMNSAILLQTANRQVQNKKQNTTIKPGKTFVQKKMSREK